MTKKIKHKQANICNKSILIYPVKNYVKVFMSNNKIVWSDEKGDLRKKKNTESPDSVDQKNINLTLRRLTRGKGRTVIEVSNLPKNKDWCLELAKTLKKSLGVGGTYKNSCIQIHGEKIELVTNFLNKKNIKWKKTGG